MANHGRNGTNETKKRHSADFAESEPAAVNVYRRRDGSRRLCQTRTRKPWDEGQSHYISVAQRITSHMHDTNVCTFRIFAFSHFRIFPFVLFLPYRLPSRLCACDTTVVLRCYSTLSFLWTCASVSFLNRRQHAAQINE